MTTTLPVPEVLEREPARPIDIDSQLEAFLIDPIGFGAFDFGDPITLDEFATARHHRSLFAAPLAF